MWLIKASLRNPYMVAAFVFMLIILGSLSILSIPIDILPVFKAPAVQVLTYYPGMPASSIEKTITNRIERWVNQAPGARLVESRSVPGVSVVKVYFDSLKKEPQSNLRFLVLVIKHGLKSMLIKLGLEWKTNDAINLKQYALVNRANKYIQVENVLNWDPLFV